ncbi:MAG TPA: hypothetical protein PLV32_02995 [Chitinophagaceae bacterium]|nr:hypothetical protein [Chitinophagaceae bacterium]
MKNRFNIMAVIIGLFVILTSFLHYTQQDTLKGAWRLQTGSMEQVLIFQDGYFTHSVFDVKNKKFVSSYGGVYKPGAITLELKTEFDTRSSDNVGTTKTVAYGVKEKTLHTDITGMQQAWTRLDDGDKNLAGVWRITGRMVDGKMNQMQRGDRKTLKILSSTRFQWMAINPATKEFFGTGGGTYTFENGKYTENIEFFSRDSTRVGASLSFDGSVNGDVWNHSGKSSKGDPLNELWTKEKY